MSVLRAVTKPLREVLHQGDQLREKAKDLPVHILQTALSGVGQALLLTDRVRTTIKRLTSTEEETVERATTPAPAPAAKPAGAPEKAEKAPEPAAEPEPARREPVIYAPRKESAPAKEQEAATKATAEPAAAEEKPVKKAAEPRKPRAAARKATDEPLPGYGELTMASLRGRLRGQSIEQIRELLAYEKAHAGRPEIVRLYENRLTKLEAQ
ncbi:hypothetical protein Pth03_13910 [Planotetraspora thailandica]|uniref:DUF8129 domain-containing protein n=1 Tax=Planotetraspora thailandica TaxID=487172 RepID=A0A8J3XSA7_9ACTN|nr:hypothetical protein [Planotetraspora thailandica]GII53002.1 hypothetical protein Pth03_13910 [Planotetraspora thailandica]